MGMLAGLAYVCFAFVLVKENGDVSQFSLCVFMGIGMATPAFMLHQATCRLIDHFKSEGRQLKWMVVTAVGSTLIAIAYVAWLHHLVGPSFRTEAPAAAELIDQ